jgi:hypothetical protein
MWNGQAIGSAVTDQNGKYSFTGLASFTTYEVCASPQAGFQQGPAMPGTTYNGCGGSGYSFSSNNNLGTTSIYNFSMVPLQ